MFQIFRIQKFVHWLIKTLRLCSKWCRRYHFGLKIPIMIVYASTCFCSIFLVLDALYFDIFVLVYWDSRLTGWTSLLSICGLILTRWCIIWLLLNYFPIIFFLSTLMIVFGSYIFFYAGNLQDGKDCCRAHNCWGNSKIQDWLCWICITDFRVPTSNFSRLEFLGTFFYGLC